MTNTTLQEKILKVVNDHYKEEGQNYDSFIIYAFQEEDNDISIRAIFHKIGAIEMIGAFENLKSQLHETMDDAYDQFKKSQVH